MDGFTQYALDMIRVEREAHEAVITELLYIKTLPLYKLSAHSKGKKEVITQGCYRTYETRS